VAPAPRLSAIDGVRVMTGSAPTEAFFVAAGVNVGLIVSFWRLPRVVGLGPAKEIILTGSRYTAEQALRWGLVTEVYEPDALLPAALAEAQRIATRAPLSVEAAKSAVTAPKITRRQCARSSRSTTTPTPGAERSAVWCPPAGQETDVFRYSISVRTSSLLSWCRRASRQRP
jgi:hypothetical protein